MNTIREVISEKVAKDLPVVIELGPGENKSDESAIGVDIVKKDSVDYIVDLNAGLEFLDDNSIDEIHAYHFLEHVQDLEKFMTEIYRVLKRHGRLIGSVPHFSNPYFYSDYTHQKFWGLYSLSYFCNDSYFKRKVPQYYNKCEFSIVEIELIFASPFFFRHALKKGVQAVFNRGKYMQELYEELFVYVLPCYELRFKLTKNM